MTTRDEIMDELARGSDIVKGVMQDYLHRTDGTQKPVGRILMRNMERQGLIRLSRKIIKGKSRNCWILNEKVAKESKQNQAA